MLFSMGMEEFVPLVCTDVSCICGPVLAMIRGWEWIGVIEQSSVTWPPYLK